MHATRMLLAAAAVAVLAVGAGVTPVSARDARQRTPEVRRGGEPAVSLDRQPDRALFSTAVPTTTFLGAWTFDGPTCDTAGWVSVDNTAQTIFFHIDDFLGLGGGGGGLLVPLEGSQSLWCGARPSAVDRELCQYAALPGYGNNWDQAFCTSACLSVTGDVTFDYIVAYETEPGYDEVSIEWSACDDNWTDLRRFSGYRAKEVFNEVIPTASHSGNVRLRFHFTSDGAWSDEDGMWSTDGACLFDSVTVGDATGNLLPTELFELESVNDTETVSGNWVHCEQPGYGDFAAVFPGVIVVQEDFCASNFSCVWEFFSGSTVNYACGGFPSQDAVPYVNAAGQYLDNAIVSPDIPWVGTGTQAELAFDVYRDLALDALIFYGWDVRSIVAGCPTRWLDRSFVYFGAEKEWLHEVFSIGDLVEPGATDLVVQLRVLDLCSIWCPSSGSGACHSHAPLFDNVSVYRIAADAPQWSVRDIDLFQDTFPGDGTTTGTGRADMAIDILPSQSPGILPGDSAVVTVDDPEVGLAGDPFTGIGPAVYVLVSVQPEVPGKSGAALTQDPLAYPVVGSETHGAFTWSRVRMDTVRVNGTPVFDRYSIDLNDNLFTPGDTVRFVFCAENATGARSYWSPQTGSTADVNQAIADPGEFQILPGGGWKAGGDILYVDDYSGRGAQPFFDTAFQNLGISELVDRYDVRGPSSNVGNGPGSRVANIPAQIIGCYKRIIWNTGDLSDGLIGDGTGDPEKSNDALLLYTFLSQLPDSGGVYLSGDDLADELYNKQSAGANLVALRSFIEGSVSQGDHLAVGLGPSPLGIGVASGCFEGPLGVDSLVTYGGCPQLNDFDIVDPVPGISNVEMTYGTALPENAVISQRTTNAMAADVGVVLSGFSFHDIRDDRVASPNDRAMHLSRILVWLNGVLPTSTGTSPVGFNNSLSQNYPNPFNPVTSIEFSLKTRAHVTVNVYNVAGQLVATLLDDVREAGVYADLRWDGRNSAGQSVASGVYFYRLSTNAFVQTRKMVLLK